jgi:hypothetical protein
VLDQVDVVVVRVGRYAAYRTIRGFVANNGFNEMLVECPDFYEYIRPQ